MAPPSSAKHRFGFLRRQNPHISPPTDDSIEGWGKCFLSTLVEKSLLDDDVLKESIDFFKRETAWNNYFFATFAVVIDTLHR